MPVEESSGVASLCYGGIHQVGKLKMPLWNPQATAAPMNDHLTICHNDSVLTGGDVDEAGSLPEGA